MRTSDLQLPLLSIIILIVFEDTVSSLNQIYTQFRVSCILLTNPRNASVI